MDKPKQGAPEDRRQGTGQDGSKGPKVTVRKKERLERKPPKGSEDSGARPADEADAPAADSHGDRPGEADALRVQMARLQADFSNFRRRTEEERLEVAALARTDLTLKLLPVIDNFDRAAKHVPEAVEKDPWYMGIEGIRKQFADMLAEFGIERIEAVGQPFDPELHEALSHEPSGEFDKDTVSKELEAGYRMGDTVVRPAKVQVSSGKEKSHG
ncbi:MAG: nucleotide exchange factor GrpE [bacterium]|nr:nucleotide exchange factor GrpE [bacterium]